MALRIVTADERLPASPQSNEPAHASQGARITIFGRPGTRQDQPPSVHPSARGPVPEFRRRRRAEERLMALPIITADQRLAERRGVKGVLVGKSGIGKTSLLWTLKPTTHAVLRSGGRRSRGRGLGRRHDPPAHLAGMPRLRGVHRRAEPGAARRPALSARPTSMPSARASATGGPRPVRHRLRRLASPSPAGSACSGAGPAPGLLREDRQARQPRRLRAAGPGDDRLAHPSAAHPRQERLVRRHPRREAGRLQSRVFSLQIDGCKTGLELPGIVDEVITLAELKADDGQLHRAFVCHTLNAWGYPAKDRSGRLDLIEEPHLGRLMEKIRGPARPATERLDFAALRPPPSDTHHLIQEILS